MSEADELAEARKLLAWVYYRTRQGCSNFKRSERDKALSDVNYWTQDYAPYWKPSDPTVSRDKIWCGEKP